MRIPRSLLPTATVIVCVLFALCSTLPASATNDYEKVCPRSEDIHPCNCFDLPPNESAGHGQETVAFCKNIRNFQVLQEAMKGFRGHFINYFVMDSCKLPPFPNGLFNGVGVGWMEVLNSTIQFQDPFFSCASTCL